MECEPDYSNKFAHNVRKTDAKAREMTGALPISYDGAMIRYLALAAVVAVMALCPVVSLAQDEVGDDQSQISHDEWRARIGAARERAQTARREWQYVAPPPPTVDEIAEQASKRVLGDDSLRSGDVVSTNRGLFRFQGAPDRAPTPEDFVPVR